MITQTTPDKEIKKYFPTRKIDESLLKDVQKKSIGNDEEKKEAIKVLFEK